MDFFFRVELALEAFEVLLFVGLSVCYSTWVFLCLKYQKCEITEALREALEVFVVGFTPAFGRIKVFSVSFTKSFLVRLLSQHCLSC